MRNIPAELLNKLMSQHQTKASVSDPRMSVSVARAKTTVMDTTYFTTETIRSKTGLGDISLAGRRQVPYGTPDRIYEIHVDEGIVKTAIREYPDRLKDGWKDQFTLGLGSSVAIAFEGNWQRYRKYWRLITAEKPYIFWVDDNGILWSQLWDEVDTKLQLSSEVLKVRAIRAWKNAGYVDKDQGVVVGYIKTDGSIYYRNYSQQLDETYLWEYERKIDEFPNTYVAINMFITNDYRMGFVAERSDSFIEWVVTYRNWAGMASPDEYLRTGIRNITMNVYPVIYTDTSSTDEYISSGIVDIFFNAAEPIYPVVVSASNEDEYSITLKFSHLIDYDLSNVKDAFTVKDVANVVYSINSTEIGADQSEIIFHTSNFNAASSGLFVIYDRSIIELDALNQGSRFAIESFTYNFIPELVPPEGFDLENINLSLPIYFEPKFIYYKTANNGSENVTSGVVNISFVVTKVGSNPL